MPQSAPVVVEPRRGVESRHGSLLLAALAALVVVGVLVTRPDHDNDRGRADGTMNATVAEAPNRERTWLRKDAATSLGLGGLGGLGGIVPTMTEHAPNLAWLCPLCTCSAGALCDAIHTRAAKLITNFRAACTLCRGDSETAESILASTKPDVVFFDVAYPFASVDTCGGTPVHTCVLCDNVTGVEPNCGVDNLGKMRDLHALAAPRDGPCVDYLARCACIHAEELAPISWAECAAIVHRNRDSAATVRAYVEDPAGTYERETRVRYHGYIRGILFPSHSEDGHGLKPVEYHSCFDQFQPDSLCRPARLSRDELPAARAALGDTSVAAAIARFYASDADAAGHAAIKAVCAARGAGTTCGGLAPLPGTSSAEVGMLVPFAPITSEGTWIAPVLLFSV